VGGKRGGQTRRGKAIPGKAPRKGGKRLLKNGALVKEGGWVPLMLNVQRKRDQKKTQKKKEKKQRLTLGKLGKWVSH